jgi:protein TonB
LTDKSGGWQVFVKPKLLIGTLIIGSGITARGIQPTPQDNFKKQISPLDSAKSEPVLAMPTATCYEIIPLSEVEPNDSTKTLYIVDKMPEFQGGSDALASYLATNIHYPPSVMCYDTGDGPKGRVICQFVVEKDGRITNLHVVRGIDPSLDKEAVRVILSMPKWIPVESQGKKVRVRYTLPINFRLQ